VNYIRVVEQLQKVRHKRTEEKTSDRKTRLVSLRISAGWGVVGNNGDQGEGKVWATRAARDKRKYKIITTREKIPQYPSYLILRSLALST